MDIEQIIDIELKKPLGELPVEALRAADAFQADLQIHLLVGVAVLSDRAPLTAEALNFGLYSMHLLGAWQSKEAHGVVVDALALRGSELYQHRDWGTFVQMNIAEILGQTAHGAHERLVTLLRSENADQSGRHAAMHALATMAAWADIPRAFVLGEFRALLQTTAATGNKYRVEHVLSDMVTAAEIIQGDELKADIDRTGQQFGFDYFPELTESLVKRSFLPAPEPFTDVVSVLTPPEEVPWEEIVYEATEPREPGDFRIGREVSKPPTAPRVGRNDLCPCGSGKKFKKCHGAP